MSDAAVDPRYLTKLAATRYEIDVFLERNPQYFRCDANKEQVLDYLTLNGMIMNVDSLELAYRELTKKGKLVELPSAAELAEMPADKVMKFAKKYGTEQFDDHGRSQGYALAQNFARPTADDEALQRRHRRTSANSVRESLPAQRLYPQDAGKKPSRREFATWPADRLKEFLEFETPDGMLPDYLR
jgi:hypothetical protein